MSKSKTATTVAKPAEPVDWTGAKTQRIEYKPGTTIFAQGDLSTSVMYVEYGTVRLSVLSHAGKEAVVALLDVAHFFGEGCLAGQPRRMATATAITVHYPSRRKARHGAAPSRQASIRGSFPESHADKKHPHRRRFG
jgi:cyclic nucleotide-binding protein